MASKLHFIEIPAHHPQTSFRCSVEQGLSQTPRTLPCRFFYDRRGSELFEQICVLSEYYPTRTERRLLETRAPEMIAAAADHFAGDNLALMELGSGSSCKTRLLIEAVLARQERLHYVPMDISAEFLGVSARSLLAEYSDLSVTAIAAEYHDGLAALPAHDGPRLLLFLGSNIGNFEQGEAAALLTRMRRALQPRDRILIGVDLVKDRDVLHAAYNDAAGVTAAFNKNLLVRINRELGGDFDLDRWEHDAPFVEDKSRIEMHLVSKQPQRVRVRALDREFRFAAGETIHTENSHKYTPERFAAVCRAAGLTIEKRWTDARDWFALMLLRPESAP